MTSNALNMSATEIVINGSFSADTNWTKDTGWTISGGLFNANTTAFTLSYQGGVTGLIAGVLYRVQFQIVSYTSGGVRIRLDGGSAVVGTSRSAAGTYVENLTAGSGNNQISLQALGAGFVGSIDNVSIRPA
jgi:argininosuccinate synthase